MRHFLAKIILFFLLLPAFSLATEAKPGSIFIIGKIKTITLQSGETEKKYFIITEGAPVKVRMTGPAIVRIDFRKNIQLNNPKSRKPVTLTIYRGEGVIRTVNVSPQESLTDMYSETTAIIPSEPNYFELFVPPGDSLYTFNLSGESSGGGALNFSLKEVLVKKAPPPAVAKHIEVKRERREVKHVGISGSIGYIGSSGYLRDPVYYIEMGYYVPFHVQPLMVSLEGGFYSASAKEKRTSDILGELNLNFSLKVVPVTFNIIYSVPWKFPLRPYFGGGAGVYVSSLNYSYDNPPHGSGKLNDSGFGFSVRTGAAYWISPGEAFGEYRFISAKLNATDSVAGNVGGSSFLLGYRFVF